MYDVVQSMVDDYMSGKYTVNQMCQRKTFCMSMEEWRSRVQEGEKDDRPASGKS